VIYNILLLTYYFNFRAGELGFRSNKAPHRRVGANEGTLAGGPYPSFGVTGHWLWLWLSKLPLVLIRPIAWAKKSPENCLVGRGPGA
jgi:hypothetical protein